jgi:hypothetical protein
MFYVIQMYHLCCMEILLYKYKTDNVVRDEVFGVKESIRE